MGDEVKKGASRRHAFQVLRTASTGLERPLTVANAASALPVADSDAFEVVFVLAGDFVSFVC